MAGADSDMEQEPPSTEGESSGTKSIAPDSPVIDLVLRSSHLDEIEHLTNSLISPNRLKPLTRDGAFEGVLQIHGLQDFCGFTLSFGRTLASYLEDEPTDERMAFLMAAKGTGHFTVGRKQFDISGQQGVVFPAGPPRTVNHIDDCEFSVLVMNRRKAAEHCAKLLGYELDKDLQFDIGFDLNSASGQSWVRLFQYATSELANPFSLFRSRAAARQQLEQTALTGLLLAHNHTYSDALLRPQSAAAPFYVRRAEAFIEAHFSEPLSLADIAAHAGVSARSLQNGFQNFRNMTPMGFLRSLRLKHAYEVLLLSEPSAVTVTEIALRCGFGHMGEFASLYRRTFGETPRQTLARTRGP